MFASDEPYRLRVTLDNASQLVRGNQVKVGGVPVGVVRRIELDSEAHAQLELEIDDEELVPLHANTKVEVRSTSLSGIANRYVALLPGPNNGPELESGSRIPPEDANSEVDLDEVLNTLTPEVLADLRAAVQGLGGAVAGRGRELEAAARRLNPALSQTAATSREIVRDEPRFARFLLESARVVSAVASRSPDLERLVPATGSTLNAIASRTNELDSAVRRLPPTLRQTNTTLVNLRGLIGDLRPAVREARPVARPLTDFLVRLRPVARDLRAVIPSLRRLIDAPGREDLIGVLRTMPSVEDEAVPAFRSTVRTVEDALPIVRELRPYTPDVLAGVFNGFGGTTSPYYDANGRYTRISFQGTGFSLTGTGQLLPLLPSQGGLAGYRSFLLRRCPGAATQPNPDNSNPWLPTSGFPCRQEDTPE